MIPATEHDYHCAMTHELKPLDLCQNSAHKHIQLTMKLMLFFIPYFVICCQLFLQLQNATISFNHTLVISLFCHYFSQKVQKYIY